jgi:hypothetical protein
MTEQYATVECQTMKTETADYNAQTQTSSLLVVLEELLTTN